ncbi:hypothetical protein FN846DRAFT_914300 [Sphaerosporella brunnea]|uniref:Uncharacterized protein n=1 Tax=Sphaerosporella brunnea TaxID=1250544 RepID=A0A5J5EE78_9PEZI|nr:hypothetical protein FN846DRAFT_914300 [Sphaerosporella brunnea]
MAAFLRSVSKGRTLAADDADASGAIPETPPLQQDLAGTTEPAGVYLPLPLYRALRDNQPILPSPPTTAASGQSKDAKKRKRKVKPQTPTSKSMLRHHQQKPIDQEKKAQNDNPRKVRWLTDETSDSDGPAGTPEPVSASALHENPGSVLANVFGCPGMDIAPNITPSGTGSRITFIFCGSS